jgi:Raf kinase inhibitor-like YbhB/YbcL family protein
MKLWSSAFQHRDAIPHDNAFAKPDAATHVSLSANKSPHLAWSDAPEGTKSFVLICSDPDVPSRADDVNQEGRRIPADLPRIEFFHWVLFDVSPTATELPEGFGSAGIVARGKPGPQAAGGARHGINDYTAWFAGDAQMSGNYFGYDGPCPPWNDTIVHHYWFTLYALDIPRLALEGVVSGADVRHAIERHVLAEAKIMGTYSLAPDVG